MPNNAPLEVAGWTADIKGHPKDASTVILVREARNDSWEIFLARRHHRQSFMAGAFVFPGGQLEDTDCDSELAALTRPKTNINYGDLLQDKDIAADRARGFFIAAIRETFEEVGILFGGNDNGNFISLSKRETFQRFTQYRQALNNSQIKLKEIARRENVFFFTDCLIPYAHWITPEIEKMRFSARFFLARLPEGQVPVIDASELTESLWASPKKALEMYHAGKIFLMPPTLKTIEEISLHSSISELFAAAAKRAIYPILPQLADGALVLPHDPAYTIAAYKKPANPHDRSRFIIQDGIWKTAFYNR